MADFLKYFITEPVYIIRDEKVTHPDVSQHHMQPDAPEKSTLSSEHEIPSVQEPSITSSPPQKLTFKGENRKKVLILVDQQEEEFINSTDEEFLNKILGAIKLSPEDTAIANLSRNPGLTEASLLAFDAEKYLLFGINGKVFENLPQPYQSESAGHKKILCCSPLNTIAHDPSHKKLLWTALQGMFGVG